LLVGLIRPQSQERRDDGLKTPKEVIGPGEAFLRIAVAAEEIGLPRTIGGDARHLVDFGLIGNRVGGIGRGGGDDEIDLVVQDQFGSDLRRARAARLTVFADNLDRVDLAAAGQAPAHDAADLVEDEAVGLAETGKRPGARTDMADSDAFGLGIDRDRVQHGRRGDETEAAPDQGTAINRDRS
jgi:hypothetical protein